ncbi:MgtC/SapB family protein [Pararhizobium haloflavum]|uniref:MgtC/SapB family protein n=1 Tax=Pararhizobium haloflavum TaxID=2037914 RepID=UPI000C176944|nr:MgtC/SapB family protein [Pararhizobium haloflavum]
MDSIIADITQTTYLPAPVVWARLFGALLFGAIIGFEREMKSRPAGLRTHALVSTAAAAFALLATEVIHSDSLGDNEVRIDPLRVIEAVTAGVAFLAAGFIVFAKGEVKGLTTGAGVWLAAAIGLSIGFGYWMIAVPAAVLGVLVLTLLRKFETITSLKE